MTRLIVQDSRLMLRCDFPSWEGVEKFCQTEPGLKLVFVSGQDFVPPVKIWHSLPWQGHHPVITSSENEPG